MVKAVGNNVQKQHGKKDKAEKHPHGGPPGQMKKELGVQTGKEAMEIMKGQQVGQGKKADKNQTVANNKPDQQDPFGKLMQELIKALKAEAQPENQNQQLSLMA